MAACSVVDLLACAQLVAGIGAGQLEQRGGMAGCCGVPSSSGHQGKVGFALGPSGDIFAERGLVLCTETSHILRGIGQETEIREKLRGFAPALEQSNYNS